MNKYLKKFLSLLLACCFIFSLCACANIETQNKPSNMPTSISFAVNELELSKGESYQLYAIIAPSSADKSVTYSSTNTSCATVNKNGLVTAINEGNAVICAETKNGLISMCSIKVSIATGSVLGCITYSNTVVNAVYRADSGAYIQLIPINIKTFPNDYSILKSFEDYGIFATKADSSGNYKFTNVPVGEYKIISLSEHADWDSSKSLSILNDKETYIDQIYGKHIGNHVKKSTLMNSFYWTSSCMSSSDISVKKNTDTNKAFSFVNWRALI